MVVCAGLAAGAALVAEARIEAAASVVAGGLLVAVSYATIKAGASGLAAAVAAGRVGRTPTSEGRAPRRRLARALAMFLGRYALLGLLAYVMMARLRLHPIGLLAGVSSIAAAAALEAARLLAHRGAPES
jgi:hypothetical protein